MAQYNQLPAELEPLLKAGIRIHDYNYETDENGRVIKLALLDTNISDISWIAGMVELKTLYISKNKISNLKPLHGLKNLTILNLFSNQISNLEPLRGLTNLIELSLSANQINNVEPLKHLANLVVLDLFANQISNIEPLQYLINLKELSLHSNQIKEVRVLESLKNLTYLELFSNQIDNAEPLRDLTNLTHLSLASNQIDNVEPLRGLTNLRTLFLFENQINNIEPLGGLINIEKLYLYSNHIKNVEPLEGLTNLTELYLHSNQITNIAPLGSLTKIEGFSIDNNPVANEIPKETLASGWEAIREWLISEGKRVVINEAKMLLLGNTNVGKSDLLYYLQTGKFRKDHDTTHGLVYEVLEKFKGWKIHCWDFGGQEFYHATHKLFFSEGALHLLLWSARDEQRSADVMEACFEPDYWLRCIEQLSSGNGNGSIETIAIENKIDLVLTDEEKEKRKKTYRLLNREEPGKQFGNLELHTIGISLKEGMRREGLKELIKERLGKLFNEHPPKYRKFLAAIHTITAKSPDKKILTIKEIAPGEQTDYVRTAMRVLHNIGCLLYFPEIMPDKVFVQPKALLNLLYENILNKEKKSKITHEELKKAVSGNELGLSVTEVIQLMSSFQLLFTIASEKNIYYIPQYLPSLPPWMEFFERHHFRKVYMRITSDSYLMYRALLHIFSEYGRNIKSVEGQALLFWKDGLVIDKDGQALLVKYNREQQCIDLYNDLEGSNKRLQEELITFILRLDEDKQERNKEGKPEESSAGEKRWKEKVLQHPNFDVQVSTDGRYFASYKDIVQKRQKGIFQVEGRDSGGNVKVFSVFDFNKYLPDNEQGQMRKIFISYSKSDLALVNKFIEHLSALKLDGKVETWYCTELTAGSAWNAEIQEHFDAADIVCFMISPNFMRTKYIHEHEIDRAFKRKDNDPHFMIVPIILDFCKWTTQNNNLGDFTALPYMAKPVVDFHNQNMAWYLVEECLRLAIERREQPKGVNYFQQHLPEDVKRLYERIVSGTENATSASNLPQQQGAVSPLTT